MLVIMALVSTVITTPALKRWLRVRAVEELKQGAAAWRMFSGDHCPTGWRGMIPLASSGVDRSRPLTA